MKLNNFSYSSKSFTGPFEPSAWKNRWFFKLFFKTIFFAYNIHVRYEQLYKKLENVTNFSLALYKPQLTNVFDDKRSCHETFIWVIEVEKLLKIEMCKEESSKLNLVSWASGVQKKQCQQNWLLIRSRFKDPTDCNQLSWSIAETLFGKKRKKWNWVKNI